MYPGETLIEIALVNCKTHAGVYVSDLYEIEETATEIKLRECELCRCTNEAPAKSLKDCVMCGGAPPMGPVSETLLCCEITIQKHKYGPCDVFNFKNNETCAEYRLSL